MQSDAGRSRRHSPEQRTATTAVYLAVIEAALAFHVGQCHGGINLPAALGEAVDAGELGIPAERPADASSAGWVNHGLERLDRLEVAQSNLHTAVNWAKLGTNSVVYGPDCARACARTLRVTYNALASRRT